MSDITEANVHYAEFLHDIKGRIQQARIRAFKGASRELADLYWHIGSGIVERQERHGWGKAVVERLSRDLQKEYPASEGSPLLIYGLCGSYTLNTTLIQISYGLLEKCREAKTS